MLATVVHVSASPVASPPRRPVPVTIAVVLIYLGALLSAGIGVLVLLSRYDAQPADVLPVSLLGAGIVLFGLLTLAVGGGVARGSRGARLVITLYLAVRLALHITSIVTTEQWDWLEAASVAVDVLIVAALWLPPGSAYFRVAAGTDAAASTAA